ncbi:MAG TPA: shikimate kinase [Longimicrobiaceae bacterium]|nr:shikimate kinase [Longimicrobiaceae bacterium]
MSTPPQYVGPLERRSDFLPVRKVERVVLLGYMASGKSSVGEALARRLEWQFVDFDVEIERRDGRTVQQLIETEGEEFFRKLEAALTEELANVRYMVLAPGGGWITRPELLEAIRPGTLSVWLRVEPQEVARRLKEDTVDRPFKELADPTERIAAMQAERESLYRLADLGVPANTRSVEQIAFEIEQLVRTRGIPEPE